jgi:hypothetical protein
MAASPGSGSVAVPRWLLGLLAGGCLALLLAVVFLLGRLSAGGGAPGAGAEGTASRLAEASTSTGAPAAAVPHNDNGAGGLAAGGEPEGAAPAPADPPSSAPVSGGAEPAVAEYFRQMDELGALVKGTQDPEVMARSILAQGTSGNLDGIDALIATQRTLVQRMQAIPAPPSCREHHDRSVRVMGRGIALLERARGAMGGGDLDGLASLAIEGRAVEQEARALDAMAERLRRGVPPS